MATSTLPSAPVTDAADDASDVVPDAGSDVSEPSNGRANSVGPGWISLIVTALCRGLLVMIASMTLWAVLPAALGWHVTVVMSGSMEPALRPGDVVASRPISGSTVRPGQVLLVDDPDHQGRLRLHRLSKVTDNGQLVLRGDANRTDDSTPVRRNAVRGVGSLRVPFIGAPAYWLRTHQVAPLVPTGIAVVLIVLGAIGRRGADDPPDTDGDEDQAKLDAAPDDEPDSDAIGQVAFETRAQRRAARFTPVAHRRRRTLAVLATTALTVTGLATNAPADAVTMFKASTANPASSWSAATTFAAGCDKAVLDDNPYLYYPLDEKSGRNAADASSNHRNGSYSSSGVSHGAGSPCASTATVTTLDGSGMISTPQQIAAPGPNPLTEEIWFKSTDYRGGSLITYANTQTGTPTQYDRQLYLDNSAHLLFGVYTGSVKTIASQRQYNDGIWHLADATVSSSGLKLYVDGALVASDSTVTTAENAAGYWRIGSSNFSGWPSTPTSQGFIGSLSGAAVYPTALTSAQIAAHYAAR